ncbi:MAG: hypothetical protein M1829_003619 [Trizodia sp. TS-e1964]|nr:MAG: hypothetical protein M1829_003619 [Trizodia sp. TS-e1964]
MGTVASKTSIATDDWQCNMRPEISSKCLGDIAVAADCLDEKIGQMDRLARDMGLVVARMNSVADRRLAHRLHLRQLPDNLLLCISIASLYGSKNAAPSKAAAAGQPACQACNEAIRVERQMLLKKLGESTRQMNAQREAIEKLVALFEDAASLPPPHGTHLDSIPH